MAAITAEDIKSKVVGIGPWLTAAAALPNPYTDANIMRAYAAATRKFEIDSQFTINPVQIWTTPTNDNPNPNSLYVLQEDPYTYNGADGNEYFRIKLRHHPVQQVQRVRVMLGSNENAVLVYLIPPQWYSVQKRSAMFHIVPQFGNLAMGSAMQAWAIMAMQFDNVAWKDYMPDALAVDYIAGLYDPAQGGGDPLNGGVGWYDTLEWAALRRTLEKAAAAEMLKNIKELADAGLSAVSTSGAGSGQTLQYTRFKDTIAALEADVDSYRINLEDTEQLMPMYCV